MSNTDKSAEATQDVLTERIGHVLKVTFNRPDRMNSIGGQTITMLSEIFLKAEHDYDVRAILLTGNGRAFCSGLDLKDVSSGETDVSARLRALRSTSTHPSLCAEWTHRSSVRSMAPPLDTGWI